jgi:uncharacterized protein YndB with AHSA1/START domain
MTALPEFRTSRVFDAPRDQVFDAWTKPEKMAQWWGPKGAKVIKSDMDFRPGGTYHYCMTTPFTTEPMWGKFLYKEIDKPKRLEFITQFSDEKGGIGQHPLSPTWPKQSYSIITFEEEGVGKTKLSISWTPYEATEEEIKTFTEGLPGMQQGWGGTLDQFAEYLARQQSKAA